jgi:hypothetical protein
VFCSFYLAILPSAIPSISMPPCHCKYNACAGTNVTWGTFKDHEKKDRLADLQASLGLRRVAHSHTSLPAAGPPIPTPPTGTASPPPPSTLLLGHSSTTVTAPMGCSISAPRPMSAGLDLHPAELQGRDEAEERGRRLMETTLESFDPRNDLGDLDEQGEDEVNGLADPGASAEQGLIEMDAHRVEPVDQDAGLNGLPLHKVPDADPRFPGENTPDPFMVAGASTCIRPAITLQSTNSTALYMLYMLVAWLHTQNQLAFAVCSAVLVIDDHTEHSSLYSRIWASSRCFKYYRCVQNVWSLILRLSPGTRPAIAATRRSSSTSRAPCNIVRMNRLHRHSYSIQ